MLGFLLLFLFPLSLFSMESSDVSKKWFAAAKEGDTKTLAIMLEQGHDINPATGRRVLHLPPIVVLQSVAVFFGELGIKALLHR